ncbi:MAG: branched-chain amino acid ABC transporter permease [Acholeplasmataceae bacterium]|nr:branched-chain amino acid ABC transporter permease [Acholeplasmataceae bacterium]
MTIQQILSMIFQGLTGAAFLALVTMAIVLIFKTSFTTNFAQGTIATFSAYSITALFSQYLTVWFPSISPVILLIIAIIVGIFIGFIFGVIIDVFIIRKAKFSNAITKQMITMGIILVISGLLPVIFGIYPLATPKPLSTKVFQINVGGNIPLYIPSHNLISIVIASIVLLTLFIALKYTKWGLGVRATASNEVVASMMGVNTKFITAMSWGVAGGLGALASALYAPTVYTLLPDMMINLQINGFLAAILGGFSSFGGPIVAAIIIPFARVIAWQFLSNTWANAIVYILVLLLILIKPVGLFGKRIAKKV